MKEIIERGTTSVIRHVFIQDSSSAVGGGLTGLAHNADGLSGAFIRDGEELIPSTFETIATLGTYAAPTSFSYIRIKLLHDTYAPGLYELQFRNEWFNATGNRRSLVIMLFGAADMAPVTLEFQLCDPIGGERNAAAAALLDLAGAIDGKTPREALRYLAAFAGGKVSGARTGTETFKGLDGSTDRLQFTTDKQGNRTGVVYDPE